MIPEESGGNGAGGGALTPTRNEASAGSRVRESTKPPGLYSDQVVKVGGAGYSDTDRAPLGVFSDDPVVGSGCVCGRGAPRGVELRADPCRSPSLRLVLKTAKAWICGRRGLFCLS